MSLSTEILRLIAQSPTVLLTLADGKALDDILSQGIATADDLAQTILEAVKLFPDRAGNVGKMLGDSRLSDSNAVTLFLKLKPNLTADEAQAILYAMPFSLRLVDILTYGASDVSYTANTTLTTILRCRNLSISSGVTLTVDTQPGVIIAYSISNSGTIAQNPKGGAGGSPATTGAGVGGRGGGGLVIFTGNLTNSGIISADGAAGGNGSTVTASGDGGAGGAGALMRVGADVAGTGGKGGGGTGGGAGGVNGGGGGGAEGPLLYYGGAGDGMNYTSFNDYISLMEYVKKAIIDWVLYNAWNMLPTKYNSIGLWTTPYGSGGGGGAAYDGYSACGGGGGGGGEVIVLSATLNNTGTIRANGGNGGNGGTEGAYDNGGGGGGGGIVYVFYKSLTNLGTLQANGGIKGTSDSTAAYDGTAGTAKAIAI
jgi:hypothetical protein